MVSIAIAGMLLLFLAACSRSAKEKDADDVVYVDPGDSDMNAAMAKGKATSNEFLAAFRAKNPAFSEFHVKKPYPTPGDGQEYMWVAVLEEKEGVLKGRIANEAEDTREVSLGQEVTLNISEISDWQYRDGKKLIGGYTIRYFIDQMPPGEKEAFLEEAGFEP